MDSINVTKAFLPPKEEYKEYIDEIWSSTLLTNQGPLLNKFQQHVEEYLSVENFHFVTNGTIAMQVAIQALGITEGEVITTPFSYVATTSAILWEHCTPVFVDIEPETYCIDADKIEAAITPNTKAILAVHVFGFPCDVEKIQSIADRHKISVIYDAAHAFGSEYKGKSLLSYGDISTCSFHATKVFHTIEGGGIFTQKKSVSNKIDLIKRFGHDGDEHKMLGINAKASEFQAAMGLCNLKYIDENIAKRKKIFEAYNIALSSHFRAVRVDEEIRHNYAYYPFECADEASLIATLKRLNDNNIFPRRYFYPSLNELPYLKGEKYDCPIAESISRRIMCLPLYPELSEQDVNRICNIILLAND